MYAEAALLILATPLLLFPGRWAPFGFALLGAQAILRRLRTGRWLPRTPMDWPIVLLLAMALVGVAVSPDVSLSLSGFCVLALGVATFYTVADLLHSEQDIIRASVGLAILGVAVALISVVVTDWPAGVIQPLPGVYDRIPRLLPLPGIGATRSGVGMHPRVVGGIMALLLPVPAALALSGTGQALRWTGVGTAGIMSLVLLLSQSPQGLLGLAVGLGVVVAWRAPWALLPQVALAIGTAGTWLAYRWWLPEALVRRVELGLAARLRIWSQAAMMLRDMPVTGVGLNAFPRVIEFYSILRVPVGHAHNTLLQTGADMGLPGMTAFLALLAILFVTAARATQAGHATNFRASLAGLVGAAAAYVAYGLGDCISLGQKPSIGLWAILGLVAGAAAVERGPAASAVHSPIALWPKRGKGLLAALVGLALVASPLVASWALVNAGRLLANQAWSGPTPEPDRLAWAEDLAQMASHVWPRNGRAYALLGEIAWSQGNDAAALTAFEQTVALDEADRLSHYRLGDLYVRRGDGAEAIAHYQAAGAGAALAQRAQEARQQGQVPEAVLWSRLAAVTDPSAEPVLRESAAALQAAGVLDEALVLWQDYIDRFPSQPWGYAAAAEILLRQHQPERARLVLERGLEQALEAVRARPEWPNGWYYLGYLYEKQASHEEALVAYTRAFGEREDHVAWVASQAAGKVLLAQGKPVEAAERFARSVSIAKRIGEAGRPDVGQNYALLGEALLAAGRDLEAAHAYQAALQLDPANRTAQKGLELMRGEP